MKKIRWLLKNIIAGPKNLVFRSLGKPLRPRWVVLMLTDKCNSKCRHCTIWKQTPTANPLTPQEIESAFGDKLFSQVEYVLCTGGEITTRQDLSQVVEAIHSARPKAVIQLSTNGLLPDRFLNTVKKGLEQGISFDLGVSLDGIGEHHDKIRGVPGNFTKADYLVKELIRLREEYPQKIHLAVEITLSDLTLPYLEEVRHYAKNLELDLGEAWYSQASFYHNPQREMDYNKEMFEAVKSQASSPLKYKWLEFLKGKGMKFPCFALQRFLVIKCNGDIVPCLTFWNQKAGNIREKAPTEIWQGLPAKKIRKKIKTCRGCLNSWAVDWSLVSSVYPILFFGIKHPKILINKIKNRVF